MTHAGAHNDPALSGDDRRRQAEHLGSRLAAEFQGEVLTDSYTTHLFSSDASMYAMEPLAVAYPRGQEDIVAAVGVARELNVPITGRGAGTSLAGQTVGHGLIIDFSRHMSQIVDIDHGAMLARVQPGVVQDQLNNAVSGVGLMFGPDTSTSNRATIGGMVGNNSAGSHSIRYGSTIDHVEGLSVVLSDGAKTTFATARRSDFASGTFADDLHLGVAAIFEEHREALQGFPPLWRHSGGYRLDRAIEGDEVHLHRLMVGSEGTLALTTEATVRLVPRPPARAIAVGHFRSVLAAIAATHDALTFDPESVEMMDRTILNLSRERVEYARLSTILVGDPDALLFVEIAGESQGEVDARTKALAALWSQNGHGYHTLQASTPAEQADVLKVRKAGLGLLMANSVGTLRPLAFVEDTAVPVDVLAPYVEEFQDVLERHNLQAGFYGHCSVGCLHIRPFVDVAKPGEADRMHEVAHEIALLARRYGGVNSSEHGDGLARSEFNRDLFGDELYGAMKQVKHLFDPTGILNPNKIVDAPPMTENLKHSPETMRSLPVLNLTPRFDFSAQGGMQGAAARCMNIGACRKESVGVMCPSYMATRDEQHATRGRANALVKALSEPDPLAAISGERVHEVLDLCLECKACKSECPLGVDMASLKSEVLYQRHQVKGVPMRSRFFGSIRTINRLGSSLGPLTNWFMRRRIVAIALDKALGISRHRPLPALSRDTILRRRSSGPAPGSGIQGEVVLLTDSFTTYSEPAVGHAALDLLESAGYRVHLTGNLCCGRASISKGLLDQASQRAEALVSYLAPFAERGVPILGIEPSCLLTLADEYRSLLPDDQRVPVIAEQARLVSEFLVDAIDAGAIVMDAESEVAGSKIVFHGHCHEKAVVGTAGSRALLERIPNADVEEIDAGCCGMAGSFGYESEHYDLSMRIGSLRLFPRILAAGEKTLIAATGTSCRQQIQHGTQRHALHPIELIRQAASLPT